MTAPVKDLPVNGKLVAKFAVNDSGYALTFGMHTRVDERVQDVVERIEAGNIYINRNQIGAIVGSQPFGGKNLSGTGPKAGGPHYLLRFLSHQPADAREPQPESTGHCDARDLQNAVDMVPILNTDAIGNVAHHHSGEDIDTDDLGKLAVFSGVREFPMRVKCASLAWHTMKSALDGDGETAKTE